LLPCLLHVFLFSCLPVKINYESADGDEAKKDYCYSVHVQMHVRKNFADYHANANPLNAMASFAPTW
jgi:hypothetical protein